MEYAIGIDIGGTKVAVAIVNSSGEICCQNTIRTDNALSAESMIEQIKGVIIELLRSYQLSEGDLKGIGIGAPGPLDAKKGLITTPPNLPQWRNIPIVELMKKHFSIPVVLENDANAATLAEKWIGSAKENKNFIYMTISTGIGAGLYFEDKLVTGASGNAGDIGHMAIDTSKGTCTCGLKGCFEWIASGTAIARRASEILGGTYSTEEVFELYLSGDEKMKAFIEDDVFPTIGTGCVNLINAFDPEKIVIGGGVSQVGKPLFQAVQQFVGQYALNPIGRKTPIVNATLGVQSGVIGAAALVLLY